MQLSLAALAPLLATASARIVGIAVPETVAPGSTVVAKIVTQNYIQAVYDVAVAFGFAPGEGFPESLGQVIGSSYIGPSESNIETNITRGITIPAGAQKGEALISGSVFSLYGAVSGPTITTFNVSVTVGDETSSTYKFGGF